MNNTHRSLWNRALGAWVAVPENVHSRGKGGSGARAGVLRLGRLASACLLAWAAPSAFACNAGDTASLASCVANIAADSTINLTGNITLTGNIGVLAGDATKATAVTINGNGFTLDGANTYRGFFIESGQVSISNLTLQNLRAKGGDGGLELRPGGGGMGAGGAVFARSGVDLTLNDVSLVGNSAVGGNSFVGTGGGRHGGGGGGLGGNGGGDQTNIVSGNASQGGGGLYANGGLATSPGQAGNGGGPNGGQGAAVDYVGTWIYSAAQPGGDYTGGGGAVPLNEYSTPSGTIVLGDGFGGAGGFGGGGGGAYNTDATGGAGGFGGGGGGSNSGTGGAGGFGGGGGRGGLAGGAAGFGGGAGSTNSGGGGAGMGGAIFVMDGATVTVTGSLSLGGNTVAGGMGRSSPPAPGVPASAFGSGIFLQGSNATLTFAPVGGATQTVANAIADQTGSGGTGSNAGSIGIVKNDTGTLILAADNTYSGSTTISGGTLQVGNGGISGTLGSGGVSIAGGATLRFDRTGDLSVANTITGAGNLEKTGAGTLTLSGANTSTGTTTVDAGTLRAGIANNAFGSGSALTVNSGAMLNLNNFDQTIGSLAGAGNVILGVGILTAGANDASTGFSGVISGSGGLNKTGKGTMTLSGANTYTGATTVDAGTLRAGIATNAFGNRSAVTVNAGATLDLNNFDQSIDSLAGAGNVTLGSGTLTTVANNASTTFSGTISGTGGLNKSTAGTLTLSGVNTYSGATTVGAGTLRAGAANSFSAASAVTLASANLDLANYSQTIGSLAGGGSVTLGSATLTAGGDNSSTLYSGAISGSGGLTKTGTGTLTLDRDNTYTGTTTINQGTLRLDNGNGATGLGASTAKVIVNSGGTLDVNGQYGVVQAIELNGGTLASSDTTGAQGLVRSAIHLAPEATNTISNTGTIGLLLYGAISGDSVTIAGTNRVVYRAANPYTGTTTINAGAILDTTAAGIGRGSGITNHGSLVVDDGNDGTIGQAIAGSGSLTKRGNSMLTLTGANTYSGGTTVYEGAISISADQNLGAPSGALTLDSGTLRTNAAPISTRRDIFIGTGGAGFQTDSDLSVTGVVSAADPFWGDGGLYKWGAGTLTLAGANTYTGGTTVWEGALAVSADQNLGDAAGEVTLEDGTLRTTGAFATARTINLDGSGGTVQTDADLTATGLVRGNGALIKTGAGTLTLTGINRYRGGTQLNGGTLSVSADENLGRSSGSLRFDGGTLRTTAAFSTARSIELSSGGGTLQTDADLTASGIVSGVGRLTKSGAGTLTLTGTNTYTGGTVVAGGMLSIASDQNLGDAAGPLTFDGGTLQNTAAFTIARAIALGLSGGGLQTDADLSATGVVSGAGGLTKTGAGTLTLAGANSYTGGTNINAGTLIGSATSFGSGPIANNAALHIEQPVDGTLANTVTGSGAITKTGAGTLTLEGENSYSGGTDLKQGGLAVRNNSALGTGALAMHEGTTLRFAADGLTLANPIHFTDAVDPVIDTGAFTSTLTGAITGPGDLSKIGSGTLVLSGANGYTGATAVTEGTLRAGAANAFSPASAHSVASGATLDLAGFNQSIPALTNAGTVSLIGAAPGTTLTISGPYVGNNGLLRLGTALGDSASVSDRLVLNGPTAAASGRTTVQVANLGGLGALTTGNGIELVSALNGATTTAQSTKDAFALQGGHVDAGAYEFRLQPGDVDGAGENWYLRSTKTASKVPTYRAEVPLFAALPEQLRRSNLAMLGNLHQRIGDDDVKTGDAATPGAGERRAWGRMLSTGLDIRQSGTVNPHSEGRLSGLQAGTDLWTSAQWRAGLYVGQLDGDMQVSGFARGITNLAVGSNDLRNQYLGGYATYSDDSGFYLDAVLQTGRHRYELKPRAALSARSKDAVLQAGNDFDLIAPQSVLRIKGKAASRSASIEVGQSFALGEGWQIQPQAQLVQQRLDFDDIDIAGARVHQERDDNWLARVGVRIKGDIATSAGRLQPYARLNLYRSSGSRDNTLFANPAAVTAITSSTGGSSTELAAGFTLAINDTTSIYGEAGKLWASGGDTRVKTQLNASVGLRVRW